MNGKELQSTPSKHKIDYIKNHLARYESIIKSSIKNGLLDEAVLFEEFARKICEFYFGQPFTNLNSIKLSWKCVDLVSQDKNIYVQVSTTKYTNKKIKDTLHRIDELKNKKDSDILGIKRIVFFLLNNVEAKSLSDALVSSVAFKPKEDIITLDTIVKRIKNNEIFRNSIFEFIHSEEESVRDLDTKLFDITQDAKTVYLTDIFNTIGDDVFHIDRSPLLEDIKKTKSKIVVISGSAGVGKSAICKEAIEDSKIILFARAEEVIASKTVDTLWGVNVREVLKYTKNKEVVICIDSLEFVADSLCKDKLLEKIFSLVREFDNLKLFVTCRTREKDCFPNLFIKYKDLISDFKVEKLTNEDKKRLIAHFPKLKNLNEKFLDLIDTPLYADIIIRQTISAEITNETQLKKVIYEKCICLKDKKTIKNKKHIVEAIRLIVAERSKSRKVGIDSNLLDESVLEVLLNNGIITNKQYGIRLKYDLFEDICFGQYFDEEFATKKTVDSFLMNLEKKYGSSVFRRYQIWVDDLIKEGNSDAVIDILLNGHVESYLRNTNIGLMISDNSESILNELFDNSILNYKSSIEICNNFAYELSNERGFYLFKPIGIGRATLINKIPLSLINQKEINSHSMVKLIADLIQQEQYIKLASKKASEIAEHIYKSELEKQYFDYELLDELATIALYTQEYSKQWFIPLIYDVLDKYLHNYFRDGERIIENLLKFRCENSYTNGIKYTKEYLDFMLNVSFGFFTTNPDVKRTFNPPFYNYEDDSFIKRYGLAQAADSFSGGSIIWQKPMFTSFFVSAVRSNLPSSLAYLFKLTDFIGNYIRSQGAIEDVSVSIECTNKHFLYIQEFSMLGENETPHLSFLGDMFYVAKHEIIQILDSDYVDSDSKRKIIDILINVCFNYSNTTASLSFLSFFANYLMSFKPSIIFNLSECFQIIRDDILLFSEENHPDVNKLFLEKQIYDFMGVPYKKRYDLKRGIDLGSCLYNLYYVNNISKKEYKSKFKNIYNKYKNNKGILKFYKVYDGSLRSPKVVVEEQKKQIEKKDSYSSKNEFIQKEITIIMRDYDYDRSRKLIEYIVSLSDQDINLFSRWLVYSIVVVLMDKTITAAERNYYCDIWIKKMEDNPSFYFDNNFIISLISQLNEEISEENKKWIKKYIFEVLISKRDTPDKIQQLSPVINLLSVNKSIRELYINALSGCSLARSEVFGNDNNKSFTNAEYILLQQKKNETINEIADGCLFHNRKYDILGLQLEKCEPFYLGVLCKLLFTTENPIIDKGLYIVDYFLDCLEMKNSNPEMISIEVELPSIISNSFIINESAGKIVFNHLFEYVKNHPENKKARRIINRTLCELEKLLYGNDFDKNNLFAILDFLASEYKKVEDTDIDNEIKLGLIFVDRRYFNPKRKSESSINIFQKRKLLSFFELNSPIDLKIVVLKLLSYPANVLMPDAIPIICTFVEALSKDDKLEILHESFECLENFVLDSYFNYKEEIKRNQNLCSRFETLLTILSKHGLSKANIILYYFSLL